MHIYIYYMMCVVSVIMYQGTMYKKIAAWILAGVICGGYLLLAQVEFWHGSGRTTTVPRQPPNHLLDGQKTSYKSDQKCGPKVKKCIKVNTFEFVVLKSVHPRKMNMEPENTLLEKENHRSNHHFQVGWELQVSFTSKSFTSGEFTHQSKLAGATLVMPLHEAGSLVRSGQFFANSWNVFPKSLGPVSLDKWHVSLTYDKKTAFQTSRQNPKRSLNQSSTTWKRCIPKSSLYRCEKTHPKYLPPWKLKQESAE